MSQKFNLLNSNSMSNSQADLIKNSFAAFAFVIIFREMTDRSKSSQLANALLQSIHISLIFSSLICISKLQGLRKFLAIKKLRDLTLFYVRFHPAPDGVYPL